MATLSAEIIEALDDSRTSRVLTTARRDGTPHAAFADWLIAPDPNTRWSTRRMAPRSPS